MLVVESEGVIDMADEVTTELVSDHVLIVTINRPQARNAISVDVATGIEAAVQRAESDSEIRVVLLAGAGDGSFCAGADLKEIVAGRGKELMTEKGGFAGLIKAKRRTPWIAVVEAPALGGGVELCLACDMIVASRRATFALPEAARGIVAGAGGLFRLPRRIPPAVAFEMLATGLSMSAERAYNLGLINRLVEPDQAMAAARTLAGEIAANAPLAVQASLAVARQADDLDEAALFEMTRSEAVAVVASADAKEGPRAFVEKRAPVWTGR